MGGRSTLYCQGEELVLLVNTASLIFEEFKNQLSDNEESLGEDASKQGRINDADAEVTFIDETSNDARNKNNKISNSRSLAVVIQLPIYRRTLLMFTKNGMKDYRFIDLQLIMCGGMFKEIISQGEALKIVSLMEIYSTWLNKSFQLLNLSPNLKALGDATIILCFKPCIYNIFGRQLARETPDNLFFAPVNKEIIESFMHTVGYQGVVDKVNAFYTKFLAQPWQTMFKVFNRCLTTRTSGHDQTKINILQLFHVVVNRTNVDYVALLWWDFMNCKFPSIHSRLEEDYDSIKDDIPLVSVYTMGNVTVRGMLILDAFLTKEIHATDDYKGYEMVFVNVVVPMNQPQLVVSTQGTHRSTHRAHRTPTLTTASPQGKKKKQSAGETSSPQKSLKVTIKQKQVVEGEKDKESYADKFAASMIHNDDDFRDRIELGSHKEYLEVIDDDDDNEEEKKDDEMGSLENRTEKMQTPIPRTPRFPRINLSSD
ncbi:hypothetical protein Tco_0256408 [Tanacetum coccineum]